MAFAPGPKGSDCGGLTGKNYDDTKFINSTTS